MPSTMRLRPSDDPQEILAIAEPLEPETVVISGAVLEGRLGKRVRAWIAESPDEGIGGAVLVGRFCRGRWGASAILLREDAAEPLARLIDRSPAWVLGGAARSVGPLLPHLRRKRQVVPMSMYSVTEPMPGWGSDPRARLAGMDDVEALVALYHRSGLELIPTRPRLRGFLRRTIEHRAIVVAEEDGEIVGAGRCEARSRRYEYWSTFLVRPEYRGHGLSWALAMTSTDLATSAGLRICGIVHPTNPMPVQERADQYTEEVYRKRDWLYVPLQPPQRFRGQGRLRKGMEQIEDGLDRLRV